MQREVCRGGRGGGGGGAGGLVAAIAGANYQGSANWDVGDCTGQPVLDLRDVPAYSSEMPRDGLGDLAS